MFNSQLYATDRFGSLHAVICDPEFGNLLTALDVSDITVQTGGVARQTNPTAVADAAEVTASFDDLGRQVMVPHQVRDLVATAAVTLSTGTETTILAGAAATFHDMLYITGSNDSDAAVSVDIRDSVANAAVVTTLDIPAADRDSMTFPVPYPQSEVLSTWTADMPDITGTNVTLTALFVKNV